VAALDTLSETQGFRKGLRKAAGLRAAWVRGRMLPPIRSPTINSCFTQSQSDIAIARTAWLPLRRGPKVGTIGIDGQRCMTADMVAGEGTLVSLGRL